MATYELNRAAVEHARALIDKRQYVVESQWRDVTPTADDENAFLDAHDWEAFGLWHLGLVEGATPETKSRFGFVFGEAGIGQIPTSYHERLRRALSGLKWHLWRGQRWRAHRKIGELLFTMRLAGITYRPVIRAMRRRVKELSAYLTVNADSLPDYGRRYRADERVASSFIESAVNQLVDKRMSKSQQMRWSRAGAHLLLQVRAEVVDGRLGE